MSVQSFSVSSTEEGLGEALGLVISKLDSAVIAPALRRRVSLPSKLAINVALNACKLAEVDAAKTPSLFASVGGEMVVTDQLCIELAQPVAHISPTQFHNSVHNTAAAYWSMITGCQQASTAMAAGEQTIAMALIEAWAQLATQGGNLLLVCYEERWPGYVDPGYGLHDIAFAIVLSAAVNDLTIGHCSQPRLGEQTFHGKEELASLINAVPTLALTPLVQALSAQTDEKFIPISIQSQPWVVDFIAAEQYKQVGVSQ